MEKIRSNEVEPTKKSNKFPETKSWNFNGSEVDIMIPNRYQFESSTE